MQTNEGQDSGNHYDGYRSSWSEDATCCYWEAEATQVLRFSGVTVPLQGSEECTVRPQCLQFVDCTSRLAVVLVIARGCEGSTSC